MDKIRRIISLFLALVMTLGMVFTPSSAFASNEDVGKEIEYTIVNKNGHPHKIYRFSDIYKKRELKTTRRKRSISTNSIMTNSNEEDEWEKQGYIPKANLYTVNVTWTTFGLKAEELGTPVNFSIFDMESKKLIAETGDISKNIDSWKENQKFMFKKLPAWNDQGVSHNEKDWCLDVPNEYALDVRLLTHDGGNFSYKSIYVIVSEKVVPLYKAHYYTNQQTNPKIEAQRNNFDNKTADIRINGSNIEDDTQWYSILEDDEEQYYQGKELKILQTGPDKQDEYHVTNKAAADRVKILIKTPQSTEYTVGPGKFTDNNVTYHWTIEGNYKTPKIAKFRQELKVKFDPNAGKYSGAKFKDTNKGAEQVIGHSMKVGESFADINAITVPTNDDIKDIPQYTDPTSNRKIDQKLLGWVLEADKNLDFTKGQNSNKLINFNEHEVKKDETFYAVYGPKDEGEADISYKFVDKSSGTEKLSPIPDSVKKDVKLVEKLYGNVDEDVIKNTEEFTKTLPTFVGYKLRENNPVVFDDTAKTKFEKDKPVKLSVVYKKLQDVIKKETGKQTPAGYIDITFKAGEHSKISNANANTDVVYSINPKAEVKVQKDTNKYVLLGKNADNQELKFDVPEVTAEEGYKLNTANQGWNYDNFEKVGKPITTATTFTSVVGQKNNGTAKLKFVDEQDHEITLDDKTKIDEEENKYKQELTGKDGTTIDLTKVSVPKIRGYEYVADSMKSDNEKFVEDKAATITLKYKKLQDVIKKETGKDTPAGYVTLTYKHGEHGKLFLGSTVPTESDKLLDEVAFYVNPKTSVKLNSDSVKVGVKADDTFNVKAEKFDYTEQNVTDDSEITKNITLTAQYEAKESAVKLKNPDQGKNDENFPKKDNQPDPDYLLVEFKSPDKEKALIKDGDKKVEKTAYAVLKGSMLADLVKGKKISVPTKDDIEITNANDYALELENGAIKWDKTIPESFTQDQSFTFNLIESTAKKLTGKLAPVDIKVWLKDTITWKNGVKLDDSVTDANLKTAFDSATFEDATTPQRTSDTNADSEPLVGTIKVKFEDGSTYNVENQKLYVIDRVTSGENQNAPSDAVTVSLKLGEGTRTLKVDNTTDKEGNKDNPVVAMTYKIAPETNLNEYRIANLGTVFDVANVQLLNDSYKDIVWKPATNQESGKEFVVSTTNKEFVAIATRIYKMTHKFVLKGESDDTNLPQEVKKLLPQPATKVKDEEYKPSEDFKEVKEQKASDDKFYDYKFDGWKPVSAQNGDKEFVGEWSREQSKSKEVTVEPIKPGDKKIKGKGTKDAKVEVEIPSSDPNVPSTKKEVTITNDDGTFEVDIPEAVEGSEYKITHTEKGKAPATITVKVSKQVTPTPTPTPTPNVGNGDSENGNRESGKDRIDTAIEVSRKHFKKADNVIVVDAKNFPDSMTASVLAKILKAPILLTDSRYLDNRVGAEIRRLGAKNIMIVGGENSVSNIVKSQLQVFDKDFVERIAGSDRYETSAKVARKIAAINGNVDTVVVASGEVFADALTVGTFASREGYPLLLTQKNNLPSSVKDVIKDLGIKNSYVVGGKNSVASNSYEQLPHVVARLAGANRYETSAVIAKTFFKNSTEAFVANGGVFADALVIAPVGGNENKPILLVGRNSVIDEVREYLSKLDNIIAIGGKTMISDELLKSLKK